MASRTGIFFHYQDGERLRDFPEALDGLLSRDNVFLYDAYYPGKEPSEFELDPIPKEVLAHVHDPAMIDEVSRSPAYMGALYSAAGTVAAMLRMLNDEIDNAFVFTGYGDHHAGKRSYGGGCYLNGAAMAIHEARLRFNARRFAIVDTDAHHGDGTWDIFLNDPDTLYTCFCSGPSQSVKNNINVQVPWKTSSEEYVEIVDRNFSHYVNQFRPQAIIWNWGYDGTKGEYGDMGIDPGVHARLATLFRRLADTSCQGRLIAVLCGGSRRDLARQLIPEVVSVLASSEEK